MGYEAVRLTHEQHPNDIRAESGMQKMADMPKAQMRLERLGSKLSTLETNVLDLLRRLEIVLLPDERSTPSERMDEDRELQSDFSHMIDNQTARVEVLTARVADVYNRLEI